MKFLYPLNLWFFFLSLSFSTFFLLGLDFVQNHTNQENKQTLKLQLKSYHSLRIEDSSHAVSQRRLNTLEFLYLPMLEELLEKKETEPRNLLGSAALFYVKNGKIKKSWGSSFYNLFSKDWEKSFFLGFRHPNLFKLKCRSFFPRPTSLEDFLKLEGKFQPLYIRSKSLGFLFLKREKELAFLVLDLNSISNASINKAVTAFFSTKFPGFSGGSKGPRDERKEGYLSSYFSKYSFTYLGIILVLLFFISRDIPFLLWQSFYARLIAVSLILMSLIYLLFVSFFLEIKQTKILEVLQAQKHYQGRVLSDWEGRYDQFCTSFVREIQNDLSQNQISKAAAQFPLLTTFGIQGISHIYPKEPNLLLKPLLIEIGPLILSEVYPDWKTRKSELISRFRTFFQGPTWMGNTGRRTLKTLEHSQIRSSKKYLGVLQRFELNSIPFYFLFGTTSNP